MLELRQAPANVRTAESSSRSRSTTRSSGRRAAAIEPSRSRSRPRTTVADALAGRIPVGMGTPAARSNSGGRGGGAAARAEGAFVRDIMRHGTQPSVDIQSARPGGLDSAAASAENVVSVGGLLEVRGRVIDGEDGNSSDVSMESSSTTSKSAVASSVSTSTTTTTAKSSKRWRCESLFYCIYCVAFLCFSKSLLFGRRFKFCGSQKLEPHVCAPQRARCCCIGLAALVFRVWGDPFLPPAFVYLLRCGNHFQIITALIRLVF